MLEYPECSHHVSSVITAMEVLRKCNFEHCICVALDQQLSVLTQTTLSSSQIDTLVLNPRHLFHTISGEQTRYCLLLHNHPSGIAFPSEADVHTTDRLMSFFDLFSVQLLDHIIVTHTDYFSFLEAGMLEELKSGSFKPVS